MKRLLVLEDGTVFEGEAFGADLYVTGELVFTTAMTGYQELITDLITLFQHFRHQLLQVYNPDTMRPEQIRESVMLLLRNSQIRNIIEEQMPQRIRRQLLDLPSRPVKHHFLQRSYFTFYVNRIHTISSLSTGFLCLQPQKACFCHSPDARISYTQELCSHRTGSFIR